MPRVPYTLVPTPAHLASLTYGRRKALEVCPAPCRTVQTDTTPVRPRPRALRGLQRRRGRIRAAAPRRRLPVARGARTLRAAPARRCRVGGARGARALPRALPFGTERARYCASCGHDQRVHAACPFAEPPGLPPLDARKLLAPHAGNGPTPYGLARAALLPRRLRAARAPWSERALLHAVEPGLALAVAALMARPRGEGSVAPEPGRPTLGRPPAASALLALALGPLVRHLVRSGVAHARRQDRVLAPAGGGRLLTPQHVLRGVRERAAEDEAGAAVLVALSALGLPCAVDAAG
jgi:hypothetical protein